MICNHAPPLRAGVRLETLQKELSALKSSTDTLSIDMGLGLSSKREPEGKRLERMVRAHHVLLSRSPSPTSHRRREDRARQVRLDGRTKLSLSPKRSQSPNMEPDMPVTTHVRGESPVTLLEQAASDELCNERVECPVPSRPIQAPVNFIPDPSFHGPAPTRPSHASEGVEESNTTRSRGGLHQGLGVSSCTTVPIKHSHFQLTRSGSFG